MALALTLALMGGNLSLFPLRPGTLLAFHSCLYKLTSTHTALSARARCEIDSRWSRRQLALHPRRPRQGEAAMPTDDAAQRRSCGARAHGRR